MFPFTPHTTLRLDYYVQAVPILKRLSQVSFTFTYRLSSLEMYLCTFPAFMSDCVEHIAESLHIRYGKISVDNIG